MTITAYIQEVPTYIDVESMPLINAYAWRLEHQSSGIYFCARYVQSSGVPITIKLHRLIAGATKIIDGIAYNSEELIDHKDQNTLNNTLTNLRPCSKSQNAMNSKIPVNNTSGYKGVSWKQDKKKWKAYLTLDHTQIHLGYFDDIEDAVRARIEGAKRVFGEFFASNVETYK